MASNVLASRSPASGDGDVEMPDASSGSDQDSFSNEYDEKKAGELGAVLGGIASPFATSFTIRTSDGAIPTVSLSATGQLFPILAPSFTELKSPPTQSGSMLYQREFSEDEKKRYTILQDQKSRLEPLLSQMPQAAFGHGAETKRDASIRDALQLSSDKFSVKVGDVFLADFLKQQGALQKIGIALQVSTPLEIELYSLNVYQKDGHFVKHKDTPRGDDMLGTLVVSLPGC
ncbi:unnamed protein product [Amoebophrya sp. A120]|nr:unnamed protein product [Amoebophrya sp. A120]|eukprot:GSA120T00004964001.1